VLTHNAWVAFHGESKDPLNSYSPSSCAPSCAPGLGGRYGRSVRLRAIHPGGSQR
jgi:hypothetical protein